MPDGVKIERPAWYAASPGTWRDWITVLHLPYTSWHLAYVLIGAGLAPVFGLGRLLGTLLAFALAVGVAAHALDELRGRPLGTSISSPVLVVVACVSLSGAAALGVLGMRRVGWGLGILVVLGIIFVVAYNLELWHGRLHNGTVFALAWGAFPVLTAYYTQAGTIRLPAVAGAVFAFGTSRAQRVLSTDARQLRRRVQSVDGERIDVDGNRQAISRATLIRPLEQALVAMSWSIAALGIALVLARTGH